MVITRTDVQKQRRGRKSSYRAHSIPDTAAPPYVCVDWGASNWRQYDSVLNAATLPEPSLAIYDKDTNSILTGERANDWRKVTSSDSYLCFTNLKRFFDLDSRSLQDGQKLLADHNVDVTIEDILEKWWEDRLSPVLRRISPQKTVVFAVAHPANFSPQSVSALQDFFSRSRQGRHFKVVVSEESTAVLHASRLSGMFNPGDCVLVMDGGKSTIDCACLLVKTTTPSLTTEILKMKGLPVGGDHVNERARKHVTQMIDNFKDSASTEMLEAVIGPEFGRFLERWWRDFEEVYKRNLKQARERGLLERIHFISVEGLQEEAELASHDLGQKTMELINQVKDEVETMFGMTPNSIYCVGGYSQSKELHACLTGMTPRPIFEKDITESDVIWGMKNLALSPERAQWVYSPQHYLLTQDTKNGRKEALLLYRQGETLAKRYERVAIESIAETIKERKKGARFPYHIPGHLVKMDVYLANPTISKQEPILHHLEIRTTDKLKTHRNKAGFQVSKLSHTKTLRTCTVELPQHYHGLFAKSRSITMFISLTVVGQDIVLNALRPRDAELSRDMEWLTLPEVLGTFGEESMEMFEVSAHVTAAVHQPVSS
ncbi:hypothetical protein PSPO01_16254 [Paraphaeosphaeria sporulosa]